MARYTRSAVSQQLSALEAEADALLVDRTGNHITLTPAGAQAPVARCRIAGVDTLRETVLIVREGEHASPSMAATIAAVRAVAARPAV